MIPFDELCAVLERYRDRQAGIQEPAPAPADELPAEATSLSSAPQESAQEIDLNDVIDESVN